MGHREMEFGTHDWKASLSARCNLFAFWHIRLHSCIVRRSTGSYIAATHFDPLHALSIPTVQVILILVPSLLSICYVSM